LLGVQRTEGPRRAEQTGVQVNWRPNHVLTICEGS